MTKKKTTKKALLASALSLLLCFSMLLGTTYAWFTDSVTSANNIIRSGNLDVELYYQVEGQTDWTKVTETTNVFMENALWEPGHTEVVKLKVVNEGSLALKYQLGVNIASEVGSVNQAGKEFKLSQFIKYGIIDGAQTYTRDEAVAAVDATATALNAAYNSDVIVLEPKNDTDSDEKIVTMVVYMPTTVNNDANYRTGAAVPTINLGINLFATQADFESDSFGNDYDGDAPVVTYKVNPSNVQDYLDGKYASLKNVKLVLEAGDYGVLYLGRPTKYIGSNTEYYCETHDFATTDAEAFNAHYGDGQWHTTPRYTTTLEDLMIVGEDGAKVAGLSFTTGHSYGDVYDYVRDIDYASGSAYYSTAYIKNVSIENVAFSGKIDINTSDASTVVDGVAFRNCSFTTGGTASANGAAIRYYNEANNGNVKNLTVEGCTFTNCYQGVYVHHANGVSVIGNTFDTLGHNAIALQNHSGAVDLKNLVIKNNVMKNVADRVIRFGDVGADSHITICYNAAVNSGDDGNEVIKASSIAAGATFDVKYNDWGGGTVVNDELKDDANTAATYAADNSGLNDALTSGAKTVILGSGNYIVPDSAKGKTLTIVGNGKTVVASQDDGSSEGDCDYSFDGSTVTFENVTITTSTTYFPGYARMKGIYNNCTINGVYTLYDNSEFNNCTFNVSGDVYNVWTWGATTATFNNCTFNNDGKAILLYGTANTKLTVDGCTFNDNGGLTDLKAAIEIGNDYGKSYELIVNNTVVNGYEINDKGINTGSTLWANKNSMSSDVLNVVVDGVDIY